VTPSFLHTRQHPPAELLEFDGRGYRTAVAWESAFDAWGEARERWCREHGVDEMQLEERVVGYCPFDWESVGTPHGGAWRRDDVAGGLVCLEHGLLPGEH
jgi:hypothetical protein